MSSASDCPDPSVLPSFKSLPGLPSNISIGFVPVARNGSREAMASCCAPSPVGTDDCNYWCELQSDGPDGFASCLVRHGMEKGIVGLHTSDASGTTGPVIRHSLARLAMCALLVASVVHL